MGFLMDGLDAESYDRSYDDRRLVERILKYFKPNRRAMGLIVLMIVAIGLLRNTVGVVLGWIVQVVIVAAGLLVPAFFIVGAIFTAMWAYCMIAAARIDRNNRAASAAADNGTENP